MAFWPNKGEADPRPALGAAYERIAPVAPDAPGRPGRRARRPAAADRRRQLTLARQVLRVADRREPASSADGLVRQPGR